MAMLLPYMNQAPLYESANFDYYWDDNAAVARNRAVNRVLIPELQCPSDPFGGSKAHASFGPTSYAMSAGPETSWNTRLRSGTLKIGPFTLNSTIRMRAITDGTSNTIAMSECKIGGVTNRKRDNSWRNHTAGALENTTRPPTIYRGELGTSQAEIDVILAYYENCKSGWLASADHANNDNCGRFLSLWSLLLGTMV
jgi:hypothetical protein